MSYQKFLENYGWIDLSRIDAKSFSRDAINNGNSSYAELYKKFKRKLYHFLLTYPNEYPWCIVIDDSGKLITCSRIGLNHFIKII